MKPGCIYGGKIYIDNDPQPSCQNFRGSKSPFQPHIVYIMSSDLWEVGNYKENKSFIYIIYDGDNSNLI